MNDTDLILRRLLWLHHGCPSAALYGDDGKMDCNQCMIDFKNMPAAEIEAMVARRSEEEWRRFKEQNPDWQKGL
jgi:hypothetical protein